MGCLVTLLLYRCVYDSKQNVPTSSDFMSLCRCIWNFSFKSSLGSSSAAYHPRWSPYREMLPTYNQLAASSLLNQQYNAALGLGKVPDVVDKSDWEVLFHSPELYYFVALTCVCTRTSWHPSKKSSHGWAGCPDCANGQCCSEKGEPFTSATGQTACPSNPEIWPGCFSGSEGEHTYQ